MKAGKKIHGKKWSASGTDGASLRFALTLAVNMVAFMLTLFLDCRELMEQHKHELLEFKRNRSTKTPRATPRVSQFPLALSTAPVQPKIVPPQWQSTRQLASAQSSRNAREAIETPTKPTTLQIADGNEPRPAIVPRLDLSRLSATPMASMDPTDEPQQPSKKHNFALAFARQAKLAKSLKKKK